MPPNAERQSWGNVFSAPRVFARDEKGAATVFVVVMFVLMIAFAGMVIDIGRIMNIHSQANSYVDRVALAAAAELDGNGGAMERAVRAGVGDGTDGPLVPPGFRISLTGDNAVGVARMVFFSEIGDDDNDPYARSPLPGDTPVCDWTPGGGFDCTAYSLTQAQADLIAAFVMVEATTETENYVMFPIAAVFAPGIATQASVAPQALAGFKQEVCNFPPLAICNPYENSGGGGNFTPLIGQQILMKTKGAGSQWAPGNFGFLEVPNNSGGGNCKNSPKQGGESGSASFLRCILALAQPNTQCVSGRVNFRPGQAVSVHKGLNVRFDVYDPPLKNKKNDSAFAPSANVTKGRVATNNCSLDKLDPVPASPDDTMELPRDPCFSTGTCVTSPDGVRFGDGITDVELNDYWLTNHGVNLPGALSGSTRYDVYRYEIDNSLIPNKTAQAGENGAPDGTCAPAGSGINTPLRDRRVLIAAAVNCIEHNVQGSIDNVPVEAFMEVFFTEPIGDPDDNSNDDLYVELIGVVDPGGDDGVLHEFPVLYR